MFTRTILSSFLVAMLSGFAFGEYDFDEQERKSVDFKVNVEIAVKHIHGGRFEEAEAISKKLYREIDVDYRRLLTMIRAAEEGKKTRLSESTQESSEEGPFAFGFASEIRRFFDIGVAYVEQTRFAEAETVYQKLLSIYERIQPVTERFRTKNDAPYFVGMLDSPSVNLAERFFSVRHSLATLYRQQGRYAEAEALFKDALSYGDAHFDKNESKLASIISDFSILYLHQTSIKEHLNSIEELITKTIT